VRVLCAFKPRSAFCFSLFPFGRAQLSFAFLFLLFSFCFLLLLPAFFKKYFSAVKLFSFLSSQQKIFSSFLFSFRPSMIIIHFPAVNNSLLYLKTLEHNQTTIIYTCLAQQTIVYLIIFYLASLIFIVLYCVVQDEEGIVNRLFMHWVNNQGIKSEY